MNSLERSDLQLVLSIRRHGSLAGAAQAERVSPSVITKRLAALEDKTGLRLFERTTRRLSATSSGNALCERAAAVLEHFDTLERDLVERQSEARGSMKLVSTFGFGRRWVGPALAAFQERYSGLKIELQLTEKLPDLAVDGFDGAVWLWAVQGQRATDWVTRRLARNQRVLVASPAYLTQRGVPASPADLAQHDCLAVCENDQRSDLWTLQKKGERKTLRLHVRSPLSSNSGEMVRDWCLAGRGIILRSLWDVSAHLANGELVQILPGHGTIDADIQWLAPRHPRTPKSTRLLIDFLVERFRGEPWRLTP